MSNQTPEEIEDQKRLCARFIGQISLFHSMAKANGHEREFLTFLNVYADSRLDQLDRAEFGEH